MIIALPRPRHFFIFILALLYTGSIACLARTSEPWNGWQKQEFEVSGRQAYRLGIRTSVRRPQRRHRA